MEAVTGAQRLTSTLARSNKCLSGAQSYVMCSQRVKYRKQIMNQRSVRTSECEKFKYDEFIMKCIVLDSIERTISATVAFNMSSLSKNCIRYIKASHDTSQLFKNLLAFTLLTMLYTVVSLPVPGLIEAAPVPWINACGYTLANDSSNVQQRNTTLGRAEKRMIICHLRGNLTKQLKSLQPYMPSKDFAELWSKHDNTYAFLKIARQQKMVFVTWHKHLQVYALTVRHLFDRAINYKNLQSTIIYSNKSANQADIDLQRLQHLNNTLRGILCDIEMTASLLKRRALNTTIDVAAAEAKIQLRTEKRSVEEGVDPVDIDMVYSKLRLFILNMRFTINEKKTCLRKQKQTKKSRLKAAEEQTTPGRKTNRMRKK